MLRVVDNKKKIFDITIEDIPLQNFEKPLYEIKKELENITGKNWQIIQPTHEIIIKRTDINENEFLGNLVKNTNIAEKTDSPNLRRSSESEMTDSLLQTLQEVSSNSTVQKGVIYFILGIIAIVIIYSLAEKIIIVMLLILTIYALIKYLQDESSRTSKRKR
ncbi:hypothetical protein [Methanothermococcus okinawensis]|uniref:Uncharacterized protein n=1 Tax=Methanothermococcus okinawensis (strain DSM 14208 / JCM 11175 / IH1) TaxID=647113 RepID=F8AKL4_METOI|nr:hypothetical protein [Methanothermococcus okinawensis]AEH07551.1 hypothetical protein Metok_1588 [Methanothermococcus okinawensis IH1]